MPSTDMKFEKMDKLIEPVLISMGLGCHQGIATRNSAVIVVQ